MVFLVRNSKAYEIVALDGAQFLLYLGAVRPSTLEREYFNGAVKHFLSKIM